MFVRRICCTLLSFLIVAGSCIGQQNRRQLRVVMYPFIPEYKSVLYDVKAGFEQAHPDVQLVFVDLSSNYYSAGSPTDYILNANADIYELDSVFLPDFVNSKKIQPWPDGALLAETQLLGNAVSGSRVGATRYGAAHWVCGNFLFFHTGDTAFANIQSLAALEQTLGLPVHPKKKGLMVDLKGKSTLGEFYLETAFDRYGTWAAVSAHLSAIDAALESNLKRLVKLCDTGYCRNQEYHDSKPGVYGRQFARGNGRALVGYSETLHQTLSEASEACSSDDRCLSDADIDVAEFPSDDAGEHQISWVDSYVLDVSCNRQCSADAVAFVSYMNSDAVYKQILLHEGTAPAYLLPAKASLYQDADLLKAAHLYPKLKAIIENATAPAGAGLNDSLRNIGKTLDSDLPQL